MKSEVLLFEIQHKDQDILDNFFDELGGEFGQEDELTKNRGFVHKYLGIHSITQLGVRLYLQCLIT